MVDTMEIYKITQGMTYKYATKYHNVRQTYNGYSYMSKLEAGQAFELDVRMKAGEIISWERQVKIDLQAYGKHICNYYIDFVATRKDGIKEYIEVKGMETDVWKMKWKMFEAKMAIEDPRAELIIVK